MFQFHHSDLVIRKIEIRPQQGWETGERLKNWLIEKVSENAQRFCRGRRFFITDNGHFGFGQHIMQEGDLCCILYGANLPMILREAHTDTTRLVGEAYVEGIMFEAEQDRYKKQRLRLI
jgi:hypothetical protein